MDFPLEVRAAHASVWPMTVAPVMTVRSAAWQLPFAVALAATAVFMAGIGPATVPLLYLAAVTPTLCASDFLHRRLPNRLVLPAYIVLVMAIVTEAVASMQFPLVAAVSGLAYFGFMLVLGAVGGMGMGDVKLAGALGLSAGMFGAETALAAPLLGFVAGGVAAAVALVAARGRRGVRIPFGPFMLAGFWASVFLQR